MICVVLEAWENLETTLCEGQGKDGRRHCWSRGVVALERKSTGARHNTLAKSSEGASSEPSTRTVLFGR